MPALGRLAKQAPQHLKCGTYFCANPKSVFQERGDEMKAKFVKAVLLLSICGFLLMTVGCSKVTKENYDQLKVGQDYDAVVQILGKPDQCNAVLGIKNCRWGDDDKHIAVKFAGNKAILFSSKGL
jgi:hypothetical protein